MTGSYDPGQWLATGGLIGTVIGWYLRQWWTTASANGCDHRWTNWMENLGRAAISERYRFCEKCMKLEIEGSKEAE